MATVQILDTTETESAEFLPLAAPLGILGGRGAQGPAAAGPPRVSARFRSDFSPRGWPALPRGRVRVRL